MRPSSTIVALVSALAGAAAVSAPATAALEPGVSLAPGSPAGKEYSFPLDVLRGAAVGHAATQGVPQPLFGVGIGAAAVSPGRASSLPGSRPASAATRRHPSPAARRPGATGSQATSGSSTRNAATVNHRQLASLASPGSPTPEVALIAVPVLLGGVALGAVIAAVRRRS